MSFRLDTNDAFHDDPYYDAREEACTTPGERPPRPGSRADAEERGYNPRDEFEEQP